MVPSFIDTHSCYDMTLSDNVYDFIDVYTAGAVVERERERGGLLLYVINSCK